MAVTLTEHGLDINGQHVPVYSGSVHYWRLERDLWPLIIDKVQSLGFGMIETYIPWSVHETAPGVFDWGSVDPRKDFAAFCELCEARGVYLMVRPGPLINAEMTDFGYPEWVLLDPTMQAQTAGGSIHLDAAFGFHPPRQFPVPSYASPAFYTAVGKWFDAVCPIIARHLAPAGCIIAVQSDNESCYLFNDQAYATDYSPAAIAAYHQFLSERYGTLANLNAAYGHSNFDDFSCVTPPRDCEIYTTADVPRHRDWVEYKERYIHQTVVQIADMLRERGVRDVPIFHDVAYQYRTPLDIARMEADPAIDWVGMNLYRTPAEYSSVVRRMRYLAGTTRLPFVPEFGSGIWSHYPETQTPAEEEFVTLTALMYGLRAINFYMLVERERWQGSPITRHGTYRQGYADFYQHLAAFLQHFPLGMLRRKPQVLTLLNYDLGRYEAMASTLHDAHVDLLNLPEELGRVTLPLVFRWDVEAEANHRRSDNWLGTLHAQLQRLQIDYDIADTHVDLARLQRYPYVCVPTVDFMDVADQQRLLDYVRQGGYLCIGPGLPYLDSALQPHDFWRDIIQAPGEVAYERGHILWMPTETIAAQIAQVLPAPAITWDAPEVDVVAQRSPTQHLIYVANPTPRAQQVTIAFTTNYRFAGVWGVAQSTSSQGDQLMLDLLPYSVQIWEAA